MSLKDRLKKVLLDKVSTALDIQDEIVKSIGAQGQIRLYNNGKVVLQLTDVRHELILQLSKTLGIHFTKTISSCGFLKLVGYKQNVELIINTKECFYGGPPVVDHRSRTSARCPVKAGAKASEIKKVEDNYLTLLRAN